MSLGVAALFCVPCDFRSGGCQNTWTRPTCNMYNLEERVFFVKSYYSTQKNLKEVLGLYGEQFNALCHTWLSKSRSTLCHAAECNTLQLCHVAKVAGHMPPMQSHPHEKRIFCRPSSSYKNCGTRSVNLVLFFSQTGWYHFQTPYSSYAAWLPLIGPTICRSNFQGTQRSACRSQADAQWDKCLS